MNTDDGGAKPRHMIGAGLLAFGAICARHADDCAHVGVRGASLLDDGARGLGRAASVADDGMVGLGRAASVADDGMVGLGRAASVADDGVHGVSRGGALGDDAASVPGSALDDSARGAFEVDGQAGAHLAEHSHGGKLAEFAVDVSLEVVGGVDPGPDRRSGPSFRDKLDRPPLLSLLPPSVPSGAVPTDPTAPDKLAVRLDRWQGRGPIGLLLYTAGPVDIHRALPLVLPDGARTDDAELHRQCVARGMRCIVLTCPMEPRGDRRECVGAARDVWSAAGEIGSVDLLLSRLLDARADEPAARSLVISRLTSDARGAGLPIVRSKLRAP